MWWLLLAALPAARTQPSTTPSTLCCTMVMSDSFGDGWDGVSLEITDKNGTAIASGWTVESETSSTGVCMDRDREPFMVSLDNLDATSWPSEISWQLCGDAFSADYQTPFFTFNWSALVSAWTAGGYGVDGEVVTATPSPAPTSSTAPTTSPAPTPAPSAQPETPQVTNVSTFANLKTTVESAPVCGRARVHIQVLNDVRMGTTDKAITVPENSCVEVRGLAKSLVQIAGNGHTSIFYVAAKQFTLKKVLLSSAHGETGGAVYLSNGVEQFISMGCADPKW